MIKIQAGPAPEPFVFRQPYRGGKYAAIHRLIVALRPGEFFIWDEEPLPESPKRFSSVRVKFQRRYPHISMYYTEKTGGPIVVKHKQAASPPASVIPEPDEDDTEEIEPVDTEAAPAATPEKRSKHAPVYERAAALAEGEEMIWDGLMPRQFQANYQSLLKKHAPGTHAWVDREAGVIRIRRGERQKVLPPARTPQVSPGTPRISPGTPQVSTAVPTSAPGRAQRIVPSGSSDRWANENVKRSGANAAVLAGGIREPLPGVAPMRTFGGE